MAEVDVNRFVFHVVGPTIGILAAAVGLTVAFYRWIDRTLTSLLP